MHIARLELNAQAKEWIFLVDGVRAVSNTIGSTMEEKINCP